MTSSPCSTSCCGSAPTIADPIILSEMTQNTRICLFCCGSTILAVSIRLATFKPDTSRMKNISPTRYLITTHHTLRTSSCVQVSYEVCLLFLTIIIVIRMSPMMKFLSFYDKPFVIYSQNMSWNVGKTIQQRMKWISSSPHTSEASTPSTLIF